MSTSTQISNFATGLGVYDASLVGGAAQDVSYGQIGTSDLSFNSGYLLNQTPFTVSTATGTGISFTGWFNTSGNAQELNACIFDLSGASTHIALYCSSASPSATPTITATFNGTTVGPTTAVAAGWHFFCYTIYNNAGTAVQTLLLDGTPVTAAGTYAAFTSTALYVGYGAGTFGTKFFNGKVDDFRYYSRVVTPMEARILYNYSYSSYGKTTTIPFLTPVVNAPLSSAVAANPASKYGSAATFVLDNSGTFGNLTVTQYNTLGSPVVSQVSAASLVYVPATRFYTYTDLTYNPTFTTAYTFTPCIVGFTGNASVNAAGAGALYNNAFTAPSVAAGSSITYSSNVSAFSGAGWGTALGWTVTSGGTAADLLLVSGAVAGIYTGTLPTDFGTYVDASFGANVPGTTIALSQPVTVVSGSYMLSFTLLPTLNCASGNSMTVTLGGQTVLQSAVLVSASNGPPCKYNVPVSLGPTYAIPTSLPLTFTFSNGASTTATNMGLGNVILTPNGALGARAADASGLTVYYSFDTATYTAGTALSLQNVSSGTGLTDASMSNTAGLVTFNASNQLTGSSDLSLNGAFVSMVNAVTYPTAGMAVSLWIYPTLGATIQYLYASSNASASTSADANLLAVFLSASNQLTVQNGTSAYVVPVTLSLLNWYHVVLTVTSASVFTVYVNSQLAYTSATVTYPANVSRTINLLGASNANTLPFTGQLDEFRFYRRALSVQDIQGIYHYGVMPLSIFNMVDPRSLVIYYPFDQGTDASANGSGVLGNFATGSSVFDASLVSAAATPSTSMFSVVTNRVGNRNLVLLGTASQYVARNVPWTLTNGGLGLSFWFRPTSSVTTVQYLFAASDSRTSNVADPNMISVNLTTGSALSVQVGTSAYAVTGSIAINTWYHVALNVDHAGVNDMSANYTCFLNGTQMSVGGSAALVAPYPTTVPRTFTYVGTDVSNGNQFFTGQMDDFRLYNRVLTPPEVSVLYNDSSFSGAWTTTMPSIGPSATYALTTDASDILTGGYTPIVVYDGETVTDLATVRSNFGYLSALRTGVGAGNTNSTSLSLATPAYIAPAITAFYPNSTTVDISFVYSAVTWNFMTVLNKTSNVLTVLPASSFTGTFYLWADPSNGSLVTGTKYSYTVTPYVGSTASTANAVDVSATPVVVFTLLGYITTVAGTGTAGLGAENVSATSSALNYPRGVAVDTSGNIYIADSPNNRVRKVDKSSGNITTVAGLIAGTAGLGAENVSATSSALNAPYGVAVDTSGNIYIADSFNHRIRKVDKLSGNITTVAGTGTQGLGAEGVSATSSALSAPIGVAVDTNGNIYILEYYNNRVRKVYKSSGNITTVAGTGTAGTGEENVSATTSALKHPHGVAVDTSGNIYIGDTDNNRIRKVLY